jgi:hypothetical protein
LCCLCFFVMNKVCSIEVAPVMSACWQHQSEYFFNFIVYEGDSLANMACVLQK